MECYIINFFMMRNSNICGTNLFLFKLLDIALYILAICSSVLCNYMCSYNITYLNKFICSIKAKNKLIICPC